MRRRAVALGALLAALSAPTSSAWALDVEALHDDFTGSWKDCLWQGYQRYGGDTYREGDPGYQASLNTVRSGRMTMKVPSNYLSGMTWETGLETKFELGGDFDVQVDFVLPSSEYWASLEVRGLNLLFVELMANSAGARRRQERNSQINPNSTGGVINPHLWVANHGNDIVTQINTDTAAIVGQYDVGDNPSRTSVDLVGDVWISHRCANEVWRIRASQCGANDCDEPRVNAPMSTNANGSASNGLRDMFPVSGTNRRSNGACNGGGVAVDKNNDPWVGFLTSRKVVKLDRTTGQEVTSVGVDGQVYGVAVDVNDFIWSDEHWSGRISKIDALTGVNLGDFKPASGCFRPYGIAVDSFGKIWNSQWGNCHSITRFDPQTETFDRFSPPSNASNILNHNRGIAADNQGLVWTVSSNKDKLSAWDMQTGDFLGSITTCDQPSGVALDRNNKIWVTCINSDVQRFPRPTTNPDGSLQLQPADADIDMGYNSYSYSDMTGYQLRNFGSDAWRESFTERNREIGDAYFVSTVKNNYGGGVEAGLGGQAATDPTQAPVEIVNVASSSRYELQRMSFGGYHYTDSQSRIINHPTELENIFGLRTPNRDRSRQDNTLVELRAKEDVEVHVAFDSYAPGLSGFLASYNPTGEQVTTTAESGRYDLYKRDYNAGDTIELGGLLASSLTPTTFRSCAEVKRFNPNATDGNYTINTGVGGDQSVYCDMTSDGGAGHTMVRVNAPGTPENFQAYQDICASRGMELIVPRSRSHARAIERYNGGVKPNVVNVYPKFNNASGLENWEGRCGGQPCEFYVSDDHNASCGGFEPNGDNDTNDNLYLAQNSGGCGYGRWNDASSANFAFRPNAFKGWAICSTNDAVLPPARSCADVQFMGSERNKGREGISGVYTLVDSRGDSYDAYCDMRSDGGGWTMTMKARGDSDTFDYDSDFWTDGRTTNTDSAGLNTEEAKLVSYSSVPMEQARVGFTTNFGGGDRYYWDYNWVNLDAVGDSFLQVIQPGNYIATGPGRNTWIGAVPGSQPQAHCNKGGLNAYGNNRNTTRVRVGMIFNQENNCGSPDSRIGMGGIGTTGLTHGTTVRYSNPNQDIVTHSVLMVRKPAPNLVGRWKLDGNYADSSDYGNDGTFGANSGHFSEGVSTEAWNRGYTTANGRRPTVPSSSSLQSDSMTAAFWVKLDGSPSGGRKVLLRKSSVNNASDENTARDGFTILLENSREVTFITRHASQTHTFTPANLRIEPDKWTHVAFVYDAQKRVKQAYLDGELAQEVNTGPLGGIAHAGAPITFGYGNGYVGVLDDVRLYDGAVQPQHFPSLAGTSLTSRVSNYFVYFLPKQFTQGSNTSATANTIISEPAWDQLESGGKLRIKREGDTWTFYYIDRGSGADFNAGRGWVEMGSRDLGADNVTLKLRSRMDPFWHSGPANDPGGDMLIQYDNFKVNSADRVIGGPSEVCNGVDDDCDGKIDEDYPDQGSQCDTGLLGVCAEGVLVCDGFNGVICQQVNDRSDEVCDGLDNDCDGEVDNFAGGSGTDGSGGTVTIGDGCTVAGTFGPCRAGEYVCDGSGTIVCQSITGPSPDICDSIDNDCDGEVDNTTDHVFVRLGTFPRASQASRPVMYPRPVEGVTDFFSDDGDETNDFVRFDGSNTDTPMNEVKRARLVMYLDRNYADGDNPEGQYVLFLTHGKQDPAQGAASAVYSISHAEGAEFGLLLNDSDESALVADSPEYYQKYVVTSRAGETGGVAIGPIPASEEWTLELSATFSGDIDAWEVYHADDGRTQELLTTERVVLRNRPLSALGGSPLLTADAGKECTVGGAEGICSVGTGQCVNGRLDCVQTVNPSAEVCDGRDNNCDGGVDDADSLYFSRVEVRQADNAEIGDWTWAPTINQPESTEDLVAFTAHDGDDRAGSTAMPSAEDPAVSIQRPDSSVLTFHRDTRPRDGSVNMPILHGARVQGADRDVPPASKVGMTLTKFTNDTFTSGYDDRTAQYAAPADSAPNAFERAELARMNWTLSRWSGADGFVRESDSVIMRDLVNDDVSKRTTMSVAMDELDQLKLWELYLPYRGRIELDPDEPLEVRSSMVAADQADCVIQDHPLEECLGELSNYVCTGGQVECFINPNGCCKDRDGDGFFGYQPLACEEGRDCDDSDPDINPGEVEVCDGIDNNCGGFIEIVAGEGRGECTFRDAGCIRIDESFPEQGRECEDPENGLTNVGECRAEFVCDGGSLLCKQFAGSTPEICDGLDNDCDGAIDLTLTPNSREAKGPDECGGDAVCSCRSGEVGADNCFCVDGLAPAAGGYSRPCANNEIFDGENCIWACDSDTQCGEGERCERGSCVAPADEVAAADGEPTATGASPQAGCAVTSSGQGTPGQLFFLAIGLIGGLAATRRRKRVAA
jgi:MYXO-CTERM domain-containing protein